MSQIDRICIIRLLAKYLSPVYRNRDRTTGQLNLLCNVNVKELLNDS